MKFDFQTILVLTGAVALVFLPQILKLIQGFSADEEDSSRLKRTPIEDRVSRTKSDWIQLLAELKADCNECNFKDAEDLVCKLTHELVCNCDDCRKTERVVVVAGRMGG